MSPGAPSLTPQPAARVLTALLDLLFPPRCVGCGRSGVWLCASCQAAVPRLEPPLCPRCGEPLSPGGRCPRGGQHPLRLEGLRSAAWYDGPLRVAIHHHKYRGLRALTGPLAAILAEAWRRAPPPVDLLVPVPLHPRRVRERGFNQAALLARHLSRETGLRLDERSLCRARYTAPQVSLSAPERRANVEGAFVCQGTALAGRRVCLIDDLCTTGATLEACAAALRQAGAGAVWAFTLARPRWDPVGRSKGEGEPDSL